jgi:predicted HAD superfamily Cof-like phosphohydrolase
MTEEKLCTGNNLFCDIAFFNKMYKLPTPDVPTVIEGRLKDFESIIKEEVKEIEDIHNFDDKLSPELYLTAIADVLGDIVIYCLSEMLRWGLDPEVVLRIIMQSNFSKLGEDGEPIYDERGKVLKGPGYWKPEPALQDYITSMRNILEGE